VLVANTLAWPVTYFALSKWLQNFAFRVNIEIWIFALAAFISLLIAFLTIGFQAGKTALADPIKSLRYE
jgi:putative ABC transport system permease protein